MNPQAFVSQTTTYYVKKTQCGEVSYDTVVVTVSPVGLKDHTFTKEDFNLFPNPNNGNFQLQNKSGRLFSGSLQLYDVCCKMIYTKPLQDQSTIAIENLKALAGVYFLELVDRNGRLVFTAKALIQ